MFKYRVILAVLAAGSIVVPAFADNVVVVTAPGTGYNAWYANNLSNGGTAGITNTYADSGNGSIQFNGGTNARADFEYDLAPGSGFALTSLTALSYDVERSSSSTVNADLGPIFRLTIADANGDFYGSLVYEGVYNNQAPPVDGFATENILGGEFWASSALLPGSSHAAVLIPMTLAQWNAQVTGGLFVTGFTTGIGSGWTGTFDGAVDNVTYGVNGDTPTDFNFEPVPEPSSIALLGTGVMAMGAAWKRRRNGTAIR